MLPEKFLARMQQQLGDEYDEYLRSLQRPRAVALRFNPLKGDIPALPFVEKPVPWEPMGYYYDPDSRPGLHPYHEAGVYYLQEASAMASAALLEPQPGEIILDLCAAPGGKSTQIAGRMQGKGLLVSNEINQKRAKVLSRNIERLGIANTVVMGEAPAALAERFPCFFHRIMVDAPCSGEGMFRKEEAAITDWSEENVEMCARRQAEILDCAAAMLRPGGRLVYSTCTFAPQEDEEAVEAFLARHPEFETESVNAPWFQESRPGMYRLWPHKLLGEGHFAAVLRKMDCREETADVNPDKPMPLPKAFLTFAKELDIALPDGQAVTFGDTLYWMPPQMPALHRLRVLRPGLELGALKKDRFEPAHALALWLKHCKNEISFSPESKELAAYLHGEAIPCAVRGWCLVKVGAYSLGWGKGDGNQLKNHYPKGLRK